MFLKGITKLLLKKPNINLIMASNSMQLNGSNKATSKISGSNIEKQKYDYFLVLDFEATCDDKQKLVPQVSNKNKIFKI
jgi:hypothetical protein